jgi:hypothetical protein
MFAYELHKMRSAELIRRAEDYRIARQIATARRTARRSRRNGTEGRVSAEPNRVRRIA